MTVGFDDTYLTVNEIRYTAEFGGGVIPATPSGGEVVVDLDLDFMPSNEWTIFVVDFSLITTDDDLSLPITVSDGEILTPCGETGPVQPINAGRIDVPAHTGTFEVVDTTFYENATYYDIPIKMGSTYPIEAFEFWLHFNTGELSYSQLIELPPYPAPVAGSSAVGCFVRSDLGDFYWPDPLPAAEICRLRFVPNGTFSAGKIWDVTFDPADPNAMTYETELGPTRAAALTYEDGTIHLIRRPHPTCPVLSVWDGTQYQQENNLLAACNGAVIASDIVESYLLTNHPAPQDGRLLFRIDEKAQTVTDFSDFELVAVDRPANVPVQVGADGDVTLLNRPLGMRWARDHTGRDVTDLVAVNDQVMFSSGQSGWLEVNFGPAPQLASDKESLNTNGTIIIDPQPKENEQALKSGEPVDHNLRVYLQTADDRWQLIGEIGARVKATPQATSFDQSMLKPGRDIILRYEWDGPYAADVIEFVLGEPFDGPLHHLSPAAVRHSGEGDVLDRLGKAGTDATVLSNSESIALSFDVTALPELEEGHVRDYVFVTTGHYTKDHATPDSALPVVFGLEDASPNPFNPSTLIRYDLTKGSLVELTIHDLRGAVVRQLVSEIQEAGPHSVVWDGRTDAGQRAASGQYVYRLQSVEGIMSKKMTLLK